MLFAWFICLVSCTKRTFESLSNAPEYGYYSELKPQGLVMAELEAKLAPHFPQGLPDFAERRGQMQLLLSSPEWNPTLARWLWLKDLSMWNNFQQSPYPDEELIQAFLLRSFEKGDATLLKDLVDYSPMLSIYKCNYMQIFLARYGLRYFYPHYPEDLLAAVDNWKFGETDRLSFSSLMALSYLVPLLSDHPVGHYHQRKFILGADTNDPNKLAIELHSYLITHPESKTLNGLHRLAWTTADSPEIIRIMVGVFKTYDVQEAENLKYLPVPSQALWPYMMNDQVPSEEVIRLFIGTREAQLQRSNGDIVNGFVYRNTDVPCGFVHWLVTAHREWILEHRELISLPLWLQTAALYPQDAQFIPLPAAMPPIQTLIPPTSTPGRYPAKLAPYFDQLLKYYPREALEMALQGHAHQASLVAILRLLDPTYFCGDLIRAHAALSHLMGPGCLGEWLYHFLSVHDPNNWVSSVARRQISNDHTAPQ